MLPAAKNQVKSMKSTINLINLFVGTEIVIIPYFPYFFKDFKMFQRKQREEGDEKSFPFFELIICKTFLW